MKQIKIVSDGTSWGTKVFNHDGTEIEGIIRIKTDIGVGLNSLATAEITFINVKMQALADLTILTNKEADENKMGYK